MDSKKLKAAVGLVWGYKMGQMVSLLIHLGDRLQLFSAMSEFSRGLTCAQLALKTGYSERWVLEWLRGMAAAKILNYKAGGKEADDLFWISAEMSEVLSNERDSLVFAGGAFSSIPSIELSDHLCRAFKSGIGITYETQSKMGGAAACHSTRRMLGTWTRLALVPMILPALSGGTVLSALKEGALVLDVGCGAGVAANVLAQSFPKSMIHGLDPDSVAIAAAKNDAQKHGLENVEFFVAKGEEDTGANEPQYDLIMCLDVLHDCPFPDRILRRIFNSLKPGGLFLIKDIRSTGEFQKDLGKIRTLAMLYGFSISSCMNSALSEPGGMGLGTLGFSPPVAARMCKDAGFSGFVERDFKDPANLYYEVTKTKSPQTVHIEAAVTCGDCEPLCAVDLSFAPAPAFCLCHSHL